MKTKKSRMLPTILTLAVLAIGAGAVDMYDAEALGRQDERPWDPAAEVIEGVRAQLDDLRRQEALERLKEVCMSWECVKVPLGWGYWGFGVMVWFFPRYWGFEGG